MTRNTSDPSGQSFYWSSVVPMLDGSGRSVDICSVPRGGGTCTNDTQCGGLGGGFCLAGQCVCPTSYLCSTCRNSETDLKYGLACNTPDGGGACTNTAQCNYGRCINGACQCNPLYACPDCSKSVFDLAANKTTCT